MLQTTPYIVSKSILPVCAEYAQNGKLALNRATGNFFYDPWEMLPEYKDTALETALDALPFPIGEARLISLESGNCYFAHSDIDDRYHLNLSGTYCTLVNLEDRETFWLQPDGIWYEMDASKIHTAVNAGEYTRVQLVVRKLLTLSLLNNPVRVSIILDGENPRYRFDNTLSPWLNRSVKKHIINKFKTTSTGVCFEIEKEYVEECISIIPMHFRVSIE